jgi:diguanylate cyclase (GGDEF)-like protein
MASAPRDTGVPPRTTRAAGAAPPSGPLYRDRSLASRIQLGQRACLTLLNRRETILDMVQAVNATVEPEQIATALVARTASWLPVTSWSVLAADVREQLVILAGTGIAPDLGPALYAVAEWVMRHGEPLTTGDLSGDTRLSVSQSAAAIALPLRGRDRIVGALVGVDRMVSDTAPAPGAGLFHALQTVLSPAGYALDTALLLKRTEELSVTDDLTRLYNARYLNLALRRETRLAARNSRPLSLLFIDLDGFKSINDSHGHLAGSRALVEAGAVIRGSARETDIVARFGGDEFALVLPDTGSPGAVAVAERIRQRIARHRFLAGDGLEIHLTTSVGVATLPDVALSADELVQAADAAMYLVKDRGKNGIQVAVSGR